MLVKDLIEKLQHERQDAHVHIQWGETDETNGEFFLTDSPLGYVTAEDRGMTIMLQEIDQK